MNLNEKFDVRPEKLAALKLEIERLGIDVSQIEEQFVRGSGAGGQKINKTNSCVQLTYPPQQLQVRCQSDRRRSVNRFLALRELVQKIQQILEPGETKRDKQIEKIRRNKARRKRRGRSKS